jgi:adenylate kinase
MRNGLLVRGGLSPLQNPLFLLQTVVRGTMPRMHTRSQVIIFLGPPGSGKGTQAARLSSELGIPAISTGEMLRRECQSGSALGDAVKAILGSGQLVNDDLINQVVANRLRNCDCDSGCILDGYPRTLSQARFLDALLRTMNRSRPVVFDFQISAEEIVSRLSRRRQCGACGRSFSIDGANDAAELFCDGDGSPLVQRADDNPEIVRERLRQYERYSGDLVRYYRHQDYHAISAARAPEEIADEVLGIVGVKWSAPVLSRAATVPAQTGFSA